MDSITCPRPGSFNLRTQAPSEKTKSPRTSVSFLVLTGAVVALAFSIGLLLGWPEGQQGRLGARPEDRPKVAMNKTPKVIAPSPAAAPVQAAVLTVKAAPKPDPVKPSADLVVYDKGREIFRLPASRMAPAPLASSSIVPSSRKASGKLPPN